MKPIPRSHQQHEQIVAAAAVVLLISFSFFYPTLVSKTRRPETHDKIALKFSGFLLSLQTCFKRWCQKLWSGLWSSLYGFVVGHKSVQADQS
ncbi:hypothetical protein AAC387_Pa09g0457 [Persea americana]